MQIIIFILFPLADLV